jgi:hypothetical protein
VQWIKIRKEEKRVYFIGSDGTERRGYFDLVNVQARRDLLAALFKSYDTGNAADNVAVNLSDDIDGNYDYKSGDAHRPYGGDYAQIVLKETVNHRKVVF